MNVFEGKVVSEGMKVGIVAARFNEFIVSKLVAGAQDALVRHDVKRRVISTLHGCREHLKSCRSRQRWRRVENTMQSLH